MSRGASGLQRSQTLGRHAARGRGRPAAAGGSARATRPNVSYDLGLYAPDGASGAGSLASARVWYGPIALAQYDGRGTEPDGISAAQSGESQTTKKDCGDRRYFR